MALVSPVIGELSGKLGGMVYSRNQYGQYVRDLVTPANPNTPAQQFWRGSFSNAVARYGSTLTAAQRAAWDVYAESVPGFNRLGVPVRFTGFQMYVGFNTAYWLQGAVYVDDAPTVFSLPVVQPVSVTKQGPPLTRWRLVFDTSDDWVGTTGSRMLVWHGMNVSTTINFYAGPWKQAANIAGSSSSPPSSPYLSFVWPWSYSATTRTWMRVRVFSADGRMSAPQYVIAEPV